MIGKVKKVSNIYTDEIAPSWWRNIQQWNKKLEDADVCQFS